MREASDSDSSPSSPPGDVDASPERHTDHSEQKFVRGSAWTVLGVGGEQFIRFAANVALAQLLAPAVFGLMNIVNAVQTGLELLSDLGINASIIQNERGAEPRFLNTAWTVQILRSVLIGAALTAAAIPASMIYPQAGPELRIIMPIMGINSVLYGLQSTRYWVEEREVRLKRPVIIDISMQLSASIVMLVWAFYSPDVWSLIGGSIVGAVVGTSLSHLILPGSPNRLMWDRQIAGEIIRFGSWILVSTAFTFVAAESDRLIFGALVTLSTLGVYGVAKVFAGFPSLLLGHMLKRVLFPVLSQTHNKGGSLGPVYRRVRLIVMPAGAWMVTCLLCGAPALVDFLYPQAFHRAGWMLQILALSGWFVSLEFINNTPILALGKPRWLAIANMSKAAGMIVLIPAGYFLWERYLVGPGETTVNWTEAVDKVAAKGKDVVLALKPLGVLPPLGGFPGAVWGYAVAELLKYGTSVIACARNGLSAWTQDLAFTLGVALSGGAGIAVSQYLRLHGVWPFFEGLILLVLASAFWGTVFLSVRRKARAARS